MLITKFNNEVCVFEFTFFIQKNDISLSTRIAHIQLKKCAFDKHSRDVIDSSMMLSIKKKKSTVLPFVSEGTLVLENAAKTLNRSGKKKVLKLIRTSEQPTDY